MRQIGFKNFRRFASPLTIDFGNINLLVGGNNSGKSTVVKALLLITENLRMLTEDSDYFLNIREEDGKKRKREYHPEFNFAPNILHDALHIGTFERAINNECATSDEMNLSIVYGDMYKVTITIIRNEASELPTAPIKQITIEDLHNELSINLDYNKQVAEINITRDFNDLDNIRFIFRHTNIKLKDYEDLLTYPFSEEKFNQILEKLNNDKLKKQQDKKLEEPGFFGSVISEDYNMIRNIRRIKEEFILASNLDFSSGIIIKEDFDKIRIPLPFLNYGFMRMGRYYREFDEEEQQRPLDDVHKYLYSKRDFFRKLTITLSRCIQEPNTEYLYAHAVNQNTLYRINSQNDYMSNTIQEYFCSNIKKGEEEYRFIQKWMEVFNIASDFVVSPVAGCEAYTVKIGAVGTKQNKWMNLAEKGMGSIQMMILLFKIATLIRKYKGIGRSRREFMPVILIEEPEQNLHPSLQSKLADLFFEINEKYKIRFIVETHSEYLIRKAQVLVGNMECKTQEETNEKNPFKVFYFPSNGVPYDMGMAPTGKFLNNFDEGFFDVAAKLNMEVIRRERKK
ncbi:AAA ATPase domain-containing protein [Bacteroidales bacterium KHT7]|nr:AAA ATPase domain-containing protein [Bacteroidales bacterium KHT7]